MASPHQRRTEGPDAFLARLRADASLRPRMAFMHEEPGRPVDAVPLPDGLPEPLVRALRADGRDRLYAHQREALDHALAGRNVVVATETASGKTLCFQIPVLASLLHDPRARALFIFPTNPLANDQDVSLQRLLARLPPGSGLRAPVRLQGAMGAEKERLAATDPGLVLANPEMVHLHLLPRHRLWQSLWAGLRWIVVDEIHLYRGAFGGHVANLLRRVRRCAWRYGASPQVIAASATVGNPRELAQELCSAPFELVDRSSAPRAARTTVVWRPPELRSGARKPYVDEAVELLQRALDAGLQSILFARSRQLVERIVARLEERTGRSRVALGVRAYRAGYKREEREVIEQGLRSGQIRGVVTTSALEVGIDIGALDACIVAGYPGTLMAVRQQAGRVGRRDRPSLVFLVASASPLDTYLLAHPEFLFEARSETAVVGRLNPDILREHLACAAAEFPLWEAEVERLGGDVARACVQDLVAAGRARWTTEGARRVLVAGGSPQAGVSLRSTTQERWRLVDPSGDEIGEIDGASVPREAHPGAVYLHQGRAFRVDRHEEGCIHLERAKEGLSTQVQADRAVEEASVSRRRALAPGLEARLSDVRVVDRYTGYIESGGPGDRKVARVIDPPLESHLATRGLVLALDAAARRTLEAGGPVEPALHGAEHVLAAFVSTLVLCDRGELEGHTLCDESGARVLLFDRHPGGLGFADAAFERLDELLGRASEAVAACTCDDGCPACIHGVQCLRASEEPSKAGALRLLRMARGDTTLPAPKPAPGVTRRRRPAVEQPAREVERPGRKRRSESDASWEPTFAAGDRVEHAVYGEGLVLEVRPSGRVVVRFMDGKARRITPGWLRKS